MSERHSKLSHHYTCEEAVRYTMTTFPGSTAPPPAFPEPHSDQGRTSDPDEASKSASTSDTVTEAIPKSASRSWSEIQKRWRDPVIAIGHFRGGPGRESVLWLQNCSLLDLFLQADRALPVEQQIMSGTKLKLRALHGQDPYSATLTLPVKSVGLLGISRQARKRYGKLPSHDMTATLQIRARGNPSLDGSSYQFSSSGSVVRSNRWPTTLVADLGTRNLAERLRGPKVDRRIRDPFCFPSQIPEDRYSAPIGLSHPALFMFNAGTSPETDQYEENDTGSFDSTLQVNNTHTKGPWKFAFEASDAGLRSEYNQRVNESLLQIYGQPVAEITLHLDFAARTSKTSSSRD